MHNEDRIAKEVVDVVVKLHKHLGPGVYENVYEPVLMYELKKRNLGARAFQTAPTCGLPVSA